MLCIVGNSKQMCFEMLLKSVQTGCTNPNSNTNPNPSNSNLNHTNPNHTNSTKPNPNPTNLNLNRRYVGLSIQRAVTTDF